MWFRMLAPILPLLALPLWASQAANAASPSGVWLTDTGKGKVKITECGKKLCAKIVWLRDPLDENGRPWTDGYNPNPKLRKRPIIGLSTFIEMRKQGSNLWHGHVYSPEEGKVYENIKVSMLDRKTLKLEGCRVMGLVCGHKLWSRSKHQEPKPVVAAARQKAKPTRRADVTRAPAPVATPEPAPRAVATVGSIREVKPAAPAPTRVARATPPRAAINPRETRGVTRSAPEGGFVVQLSARRSEAEAREAMSKLRRQYPTLNDYNAFIQRADLGERGVWYRLRFGTLTGKAAASDLCAELIASGLPDCLVRRP